ncbi:MAG: hypothetical protein EZS26_002934 [Candidatus Ordinivivax streblomastigis]|uniref:LamG domain-containing protein n=1 Tax=Candidatus Ordinivivax streblomastigis TaxID=2540710 RepID=A0A5M8NWZ4_9BACT|nr:MAG: hypothetical protein EZS26_002934 [Candidatus Ordinivivax streblomastigis]
MDASNVILNLPFDESVGSTIAYDYSQSRADGQVFGAQFVSGKNGNAIRFGGKDTCEVPNNVLPDLNVDFSILMWVQNIQIECGSPEKLIWLLNFTGFNNYVEVPIEAKPGTWLPLALTHSGAVFHFYVNASLIRTITKEGTLIGVSLNQDYYGGDYGLALLDDVRLYHIALTQSELIQEAANSKRQTYLIDGVDFKEYGVYVSESEGVINRPRLKNTASLSWDDYHGESVDLTHKFYEPREITLSCFIKAGSKSEFIMRVFTFEQLFDRQGTQRLVIDVHPTKPLIYEVYCKDEITLSKKWNDGLMVGTFQLKLVEPEPVKRVLKHIGVSEATRTCTVTLTTQKLVTIYWGDGLVDFDISGENLTISHHYADNGEYFPVITGCIDEISSFATNAIIVWNKL